MDTEVKKPLKTIVTFSNDEVFARAIAEPNTSALVEALLANYFGFEVEEGTSVQTKWRKHYADKLSDVELQYVEVDTPVAPEPQVLDDINDEDGDIAEDDEPIINDPLGAYTETPAAPAEEVPTADTAPIVPTPAPEVLPDRPVDAVQSEESAFVPADGVGPSVAEATEVQEQTEPVVEPAVDQSPAEEDTAQPIGRYCPNCGRPMGDSPHCLYCI